MSECSNRLGDSSDISLRDFSYKGLSVSEWCFEPYTGVRRASGIQKDYRVYHTGKEHSESTSGGFHFCVVKVEESRTQKTMSDGDGSFDQTTLVNPLVVGSAKPTGIHRTKPTKSGQSLQGLPPNDFMALCDILRSLEQNYCSSVER